MKFHFSNIFGEFNLDAASQLEALAHFKDKKYFKKFYDINMKMTMEDIKDSVSDDQLIIQSIANINELDRTTNLLSKRLREWYGLCLPELSAELSDHKKFAELISQPKKDLMEQLNLTISMGADLDDKNLKEIQLLAKQVVNMFELRQQHEDYLQEVMKVHCPNVLELAGTTIGAGLIELAKGLKRMALLPSSTIQLLGAEKALFRHLKVKSKSPKHGIIVNHPYVQKAKNKGKAARMLADKLSLCAQLDFFKGEFKAKEYKKELEKKQ